MSEAGVEVRKKSSQLIPRDLTMSGFRERRDFISYTAVLQFCETLIGRNNCDAETTPDKFALDRMKVFYFPSRTLSGKYWIVIWTYKCLRHENYGLIHELNVFKHRLFLCFSTWYPCIKTLNLWTKHEISFQVIHLQQSIFLPKPRLMCRMLTVTLPKKMVNNAQNNLQMWSNFEVMISLQYEHISVQDMKKMV